MRTIEKLLGEYAESHQTPLNQIIHYICVPAIFFSLIGLLICIPVPETVSSAFPPAVAPYVNFGTLVIILGLIYYLRLSFTLFIGMLIVSSLALFGIRQMELLNIAPLWSIMVGVFVIAWIGQFYGHNHEGKKPSFLKDIQFLMIGPAWTLSHLFDALKIKY